MGYTDKPAKIFCVRLSPIEPRGNEGSRSGSRIAHGASLVDVLIFRKNLSFVRFISVAQAKTAPPVFSATKVDVNTLNRLYHMRRQTVTDKTAEIGEIVQVMLNTWDFPADCNEGELFTYAETLYDRIVAGDSKDKLYAYLSGVQIDQLEMAESGAFRTIVDRAATLVSGSR
jgi:hypothetical protein